MSFFLLIFHTPLNCLCYADDLQAGRQSGSSAPPAINSQLMILKIFRMIKQKCTSEALGTDITISVYASVEGDFLSFVFLRGYDEWFYGIYEFAKDSGGF